MDKTFQMMIDKNVQIDEHEICQISKGCVDFNILIGRTIVNVTGMLSKTQCGKEVQLDIGCNDIRFYFDDSSFLSIEYQKIECSYSFVIDIQTNDKPVIGHKVVSVSVKDTDEFVDKRFPFKWKIFSIKTENGGVMIIRCAITYERFYNTEVNYEMTLRKYFRDVEIGETIYFLIAGAYKKINNNHVIKVDE